ncbi:MAG: zf-TFIIB domain-containing protein [Chloroflexi bacterium]|nr:zf-TFIIB domain-containing protein [Chloroflexota bacterium]
MTPRRLPPGGKRRTFEVLCPRCKIELRMSDRQNVEIDYCPQCRGIWLDRGELDKIIDRSMIMMPVAGGAASGYSAQAAERAPEPERHRDEDDDRPAQQGRAQDHPDGHRRNAYSGMRKRGWLGDLLDFD